MSKCNNCNFYEAINNTAGRCMYIPRLSSSGKENAVFPVVEGDVDWCSKYSIKEVKEGVLEERVK